MGNDLASEFVFCERARRDEPVTSEKISMQTLEKRFSIRPRAWRGCAFGLFMFTIALGLSGAVFGGERGRYTRDDGYAFYDIVWMEQRADHDTALLLHFNVPQPPAWALPGERKLARKQEAKEKDEEIGRASCRERVYTKV